MEITIEYNFNISSLNVGKQMKMSKCFYSQGRKNKLSIHLQFPVNAMTSITLTTFKTKVKSRSSKIDDVIAAVVPRDHVFAATELRIISGT